MTGAEIVGKIRMYANENEGKKHYHGTRVCLWFQQHYGFYINLAPYTCDPAGNEVCSGSVPFVQGVAESFKYIFTTDHHTAKAKSFKPHSNYF